MIEIWKDEDIVIYKSFECKVDDYLDLAKISAAVKHLTSNNNLPSFANNEINVVYDGYGHSRILFSLDTLCFKCEWNQYLYLRPFPLLPLSMRIFAYEECMRRGLSCPKLLGAFSVKEGRDWLWNGIIMEYLEGWRTLDRKDPEDIKLAEEAVDQMVKLRIHDDDFHQKNIMTDGNGNWKIVDLDQMRFYGLSPEESRKQMMEKFLTLEI